MANLIKSNFKRTCCNKNNYGKPKPIQCDNTQPLICRNLSVVCGFEVCSCVLNFNGDKRLQN